MARAAVTCGAKTKASAGPNGELPAGRPCGMTAGWGTDHLGAGPCKLHGGSTPAVREAVAVAQEVLRAEAQLKEAKAAASRAVSAFGGPIVDVNPEEALLGLVREAAGNVAWLGSRVQVLLAEEGLDDPSISSGSWRVRTRYAKGSSLFGPKILIDKDGGEHIVGEELRGMVALYNDERDRLAKVAKAALDAGIAKAQVEIARSQGQAVVIVVNRVLVQLGLPEAQATLARELIATEFRKLGSGDDAGLGIDAIRVHEGAPIGKGARR